MKRIVFDAKLCNGCYSCQFACKDEHCGNDWSPIAVEQPMSGQFWLQMQEEERGAVPEVKVQYVPLMCGHCDDAPCLKAGRADGAVYRREDGLVIIDPEKAKGRQGTRCLLSRPQDLLERGEADSAEVHGLRSSSRRRLGGASLRRRLSRRAPSRCVDEADVPAEAVPMPDSLVGRRSPRACIANVPKRWIYGVPGGPLDQRG